MRKTLILILVVLFVTICTRAQFQPGDEDIQQWNEIQLSVPVTEKIDFNTQVTLRLGNDVSRLNEGRFGLGVAFKPDKHWTLAANYQYIDARNSAGSYRREDRFDARLSYKFPVKKFGLSHRSTVEYRLRSAGNTWRYRPSITIDKDLKFIPGSKIYLTEEVFYDSGLEKFSRNRFTIGINKTLTKKFSVDIYYMRQNDGFSAPGDLNVIGTSWKVRL